MVALASRNSLLTKGRTITIPGGGMGSYFVPSFAQYGWNEMFREEFLGKREQLVVRRTKLVISRLKKGADDCDIITALGGQRLVETKFYHFDRFLVIANKRNDYTFFIKNPAGVLRTITSVWEQHGWGNDGWYIHAQPVGDPDTFHFFDTYMVYDQSLGR